MAPEIYRICYGLDDLGIGVQFAAWARDFFLFFCVASRLALRHPPPPLSMQCIQGTVSPDVKLSELEDNHSSPFLVEVRNGGVHIHSPKYLHVLWIN
jgi:hypothetical protein